MKKTLRLKRKQINNYMVRRIFALNRAAGAGVTNRLSAQNERLYGVIV
ncbi:MAG: hypothetical protein V3R68_07190 [Gammaproteobacteria bacterium]